jgi:anti-sigma factor RsiW
VIALHLDDERAQRLLEGLLPEPERAEADAHLAGCPGCRDLVASYRALSEALDGLPSEEPPSTFTAGVLARIERRERSAAWERRLALAILAAAAAAAAAFLAAGSQGAWAPTLSIWSGALVRTATALRIGADVAAPMLGALRIPIAACCAALGLPILFALGRLVPARQRGNA